MTPGTAAASKTVAHIVGGREMGGIATVVFSLLEAQRAYRNPILLALEDSGLVEAARENGYRTEVIPGSPVVAPVALSRMIRLMKSERVALIHTHSIPGHIYGHLIRRLMRTVFFLAHVHANFHRELLSQGSHLLKRKFYYNATLSALRGCDAVITNSAAVRHDLVGRGIEERKVTVVHNGVDAERIRREAESQAPSADLLAKLGAGRVVGTIGRFARVKNQRLLLEAARIVLDELPDVRFLLVGDGAERGHLEQTGHDLGLDGSLIFTGWQSEPYSLLSRMDVLVLPSRWEGLGMAVLEAMALAKPVVATRVGGVPEVVRDGETGILVSSEDAEGLANAILTLLSDPDRASAMGRRGSRVVNENFTSARMSREIEGIYRASIGESN